CSPSSSSIPRLTMVLATIANVRDGMFIFSSSSAILAGPAASASNKPTSFAAKRCFAAMKPMAIFMMESGVTSGMGTPFLRLDTTSSNANATFSTNCTPLSDRQPCGSPSLRQGCEHRRLDTDRDRKSIDGEGGVAREHLPRLGGRFFMASKPHQRCDEKEVTHAETRVQLHRAARCVMGIRAPSAVKI